MLCLYTPGLESEATIRQWGLCCVGYRFCGLPDAACPDRGAPQKRQHEPCSARPRESSLCVRRRVAQRRGGAASRSTWHISTVLPARTATQESGNCRTTNSRAMLPVQDSFSGTSCVSLTCPSAAGLVLPDKRLSPRRPVSKSMSTKEAQLAVNGWVGTASLNCRDGRLYRHLQTWFQDISWDQC